MFGKVLGQDAKIPTTCLGQKIAERLDFVDRDVYQPFFVIGRAPRSNPSSSPQIIRTLFEPVSLSVGATDVVRNELGHVVMISLFESQPG